MNTNKFNIVFFIYDWNKEVTLPFFRGVEQFLQKHPDVHVTIMEGIGRYAEVSMDANSLKIFQLPDLSSFDGVLIHGNGVWSPEDRQALADQAIRCGKPVVSLNYQLRNSYYVGTDNYSAMKIIVSHVIEKHQARKLAFVRGLKGNREAEDRERAFRDCCRAHGVPEYDCKGYDASWSREDGYKAGKKILQDAGMGEDTHLTAELPDAVICANDDLAVGVIDAMKEANISVPDQVKVTGFDYLSIGEMNAPQLSTISRDYEKVAYLGLQVLYDKLYGKEVPKIRYSKARLIEGGSCGCVNQEVLTRHLLDRFFRLDRLTKQFYAIRDFGVPKLEQAENLSEIMEIFEEYARETGVGTACVVIQKDYLEKFQYGAEYTVKDYGNQMVLMGLSGWEEWNQLSCDERHVYLEFAKYDMVPDFLTEKKQLHLLLPLRYEEMLIGYVIVDRISDGMEFQFLDYMLKYVGNAIEAVRQKHYRRILEQRLHLYEKEALGKTSGKL